MSKNYLPDVELTQDQKKLITLVDDWYHDYEHSYKKSDQVFVYSGFPGTGKTFILNFIVYQLGIDWDDVIFCAFTGKAASNLCKQGFRATTIHSAFFESKEVPKIKDGKFVTSSGRIVKELRFVEREWIDPRYKLVIIDEWGTVNEQLAHAILKHNIPVIAAGDKDQLPPITGESPFANMVRFSLTQIMRQASYSGIITLASLIRQGMPLPEYQNYYNDAHVMCKRLMTNKDLLNADMVLTVKNKTRNYFNDKIRALHGSYGKFPEVGDKLICRKNSWWNSLDGIPLINGTIGKLYSPIRKSEFDMTKKLYYMDFQPDYEYDTFEFYDDLPCDYDFLVEPCGNKEISVWNPGCKFEFAEAITVALSQGSQYGKVVYYDEVCGDSEFMRKVRYTACTRAIDHVVMFF